MKKLVAVASFLILVGSGILVGIFDELAMFILVGRLPFTNHSLQPQTMLLFWLVIVPVIILTYRQVINVSWRAIESLGRISQRRINEMYYRSRQAKSIWCLVASIIVNIDTDIETSLSDEPELFMRRRFLALPEFASL